MVKKYFYRRTNKKRKQRGGKESVGYNLALQPIEGTTSFSRVDSYSTCNKPTFGLPLDKPFYDSTSAKKVGGRTRKYRTRRTRKYRTRRTRKYRTRRTRKYRTRRTRKYRTRRNKNRRYRTRRYRTKR